DNELERCAAEQNQIQGAVLVVSSEQAIERKERREQRAKPQNRRTDATQQCEIRSNGKRNQRDHGQKEKDAHQRSAAHAHGNSHIAKENRSKGVHGPSLSSVASMPSGPWVAATISPPPTVCARISSPSRA